MADFGENTLAHFGGIMQTIRLHGELSELFIDEAVMEVSSVAEAIRALDANFEGFSSYIMGEERSFALVIGGVNVGEESIPVPIGQNSIIEIYPIIQGAGGDSGFGQILLGAVLIAASFFTGGATLAGFQLAPVLSKIGFSLLIGGVTQLLFGQQPVKTEAKEAPENTPSDYFNGPVNTTAEGQTVPVGYGTMIIGSHVVSAGFIVRDGAV